ncbi:hypothetical protein F5X97DRAFT_321586 [Nemania serpens]|nr:hypothetical protein F5X97DRAFT_321586 [Nemania serpens]
MNTFMAVGAQLLRTGDYSDFTLVCGGQEFRVHKNIVCSQSPVISAALKSGFKEGKTNTMEVNFDVKLLKSMLDYMYTATYQENPVRPIRRSPPADNANINKQLSQQNPFQIRARIPFAAATNVSENLIYHARVNSIADYYGVKGLAKLSITRIKTLLKTSWSADAFCDLIRETDGSTGDKDLREVLIESASSNIFELMDKDVFSEGKISNDWAASFLKGAINVFKATQHSSQLANAEVSAKVTEIDNLMDNLNELTDVLFTTHTCHNRECKPRFGFNIEQPSQNTEKRWLVCCPQCGRRYTYDKKRKATDVLLPPPRPAN